MAAHLNGAYDVLFIGKSGQCTPKFILDLPPLKAATGVTEEDVAKHLQDFGDKNLVFTCPPHRIISG
jgi:glycine dehydrogenase